MNSNWEEYLQRLLKNQEKEFIRFDTLTFSKQDIYLQILEFSKKLYDRIGTEKIPISILGMSDISFLIAFLGTLLNGQIPFLFGRHSANTHLFPNSIQSTPISTYSLGNEIFINFDSDTRKKESTFDSGSDFFIQSSGTMGVIKWIGLHFDNLIESIALHKEKIQIKNCTTISVLPYFHIFGLVLDFFLSLEFKNNT